MKTWIFGVAITLGVTYGLSRLPGLLLAWLKDKIHKAFDAGDDIDDKLLAAVCAWAEEKILRRFPCASGDEPYAAAARQVIAHLPLAAQPFVREQKLSASLKELITGLLELLRQKNSADTGGQPVGNATAPEACA